MDIVNLILKISRIKSYLFEEISFHKVSEAPAEFKSVEESLTQLGVPHWLRILWFNLGPYTTMDSFHTIIILFCL